MKSLIDRKPTFPIGSTFLDSWTIYRPIFCVESYEIYEIQSNSKNIWGLMIRCKTNDEAMEQNKKHSRGFMIRKITTSAEFLRIGGNLSGLLVRMSLYDMMATLSRVFLLLILPVFQRLFIRTLKVSFHLFIHRPLQNIMEKRLNS